MARAMMSPSGSHTDCKRLSIWPNSLMTSDLEEHEIALGHVPALAVSLGPSSAAARRGTVLILHGLGGSKEVHAAEARALALRGFLAVCLDAVGHGARRYSDFEERFSPARAERSYFEVVQQTAGELPAVLSAMNDQNWAHSGRIAACGISMGGAVLFGAISANCKLDAAAMLVASPHWFHVEESPHERPERFFPTPILIQTGGADTVVPPSAARALYQALVPRYTQAPDHLRYIEHPHESHMLSESAWNPAWREILDWFERFLSR
jgi:uncharacterized protein